MQIQKIQHECRFACVRFLQSNYDDDDDAYIGGGGDAGGGV